MAQEADANAREPESPLELLWQHSICSLFIALRAVALGEKGVFISSFGVLGSAGISAVVVLLGDAKQVDQERIEFRCYARVH